MIIAMKKMMVMKMIAMMFSVDDDDMSSGMFHDHRVKPAVHVCILLALLSVCIEQSCCGIESCDFALMQSTL